MTKYRAKNYNRRKYTSKYHNKRYSRKFKRYGYAVAKRNKDERTIFGYIYVTNDSLVSRDGYSKEGRKVVVVNNNSNRVYFKKIFGLYDDSGRRRRGLTPIARYKCFTKPSGLNNRVHKKTSSGKPIKLSFLKKTGIRFNKDDLKKIFRS